MPLRAIAANGLLTESVLCEPLNARWPLRDAGLFRETVLCPEGHRPLDAQHPMRRIAAYLGGACHRYHVESDGLAPREQ
jgi:hypothetical protein